MALYGRNPVLSRRLRQWLRRAILCTAVLAGTGCGLVLDGVQYLMPTENARKILCDRELLQIGLAAGPYPPFVFPIADTDQGPRVTGLDIQLVQEIVSGFQRRCGHAVRPILRLVPFLDLFTLVNEGKLDLFLSATAADVAGTGRGGFAYSIPYVSRGGLSVAARTEEIAEEIRRRVEADSAERTDPQARRQALTNYQPAVVDGSSAAAYAEANFMDQSFVVCNTLTAAMKPRPEVASQPDIVLGSAPVLAYVARMPDSRWTLVKLADSQPLLLTHENLSIITGEDRLYLRWFLNDLLFRLDESGDLDRIRQRWLAETYDAAARAAAEGLPVEPDAKEIQARDHCYVGTPGFGRLRALGRE